MLASLTGNMKVNELESEANEETEERDGSTSVGILCSKLETKRYHQLNSLAFQEVPSLE